MIYYQIWEDMTVTSKIGGWSSLCVPVVMEIDCGDRSACSIARRSAGQWILVVAVRQRAWGSMLGSSYQALILWAGEVALCCDAGRIGYWNATEDWTVESWINVLEGKIVFSSCGCECLCSVSLSVDPSQVSLVKNGCWYVWKIIIYGQR